jgi:hypothetical protein
MNVRFDGADLGVVRFEETPLIRASFARALLVRVVFADTRMGGTPLDRASFVGAHLVDCSFRGANLRGTTMEYAGREHDPTNKPSTLFSRFEVSSTGPIATAEEVRAYAERVAAY